MTNKRLLITNLVTYNTFMILEFGRSWIHNDCRSKIKLPLHSSLNFYRSICVLALLWFERLPQVLCLVISHGSDLCFCYPIGFFPSASIAIFPSYLLQSKRTVFWYYTLQNSVSYTCHRNSLRQEGQEPSPATLYGWSHPFSWILLRWWRRSLSYTQILFQ